MTAGAAVYLIAVAIAMAPAIARWMLHVASVAANGSSSGKTLVIVVAIVLDSNKKRLHVPR